LLAIEKTLLEHAEAFILEGETKANALPEHV
jgi:hypothetical protein